MTTSSTLEDLAASLLPKQDESEIVLIDEEDGFFSAVSEDRNEVSFANASSFFHTDEHDYLTSNNDDSLLWRIVQRLLYTPLLPECDPFRLQIRFFKFLVLTVLGITATHYTVLWMVSNSCVTVVLFVFVE